MRLRFLAAAALATATLPLGAPPALAHGLCIGLAATPFTNDGRQVYGSGAVDCLGTPHTEIQITVCLQYSPVDVDLLFTDQFCTTQTFTEPNGYAYVGAIATATCPFLTGYYRTHVVGAIPGHADVPTAISGSALVVSDCNV